jgi:hypothetical protein
MVQPCQGKNATKSSSPLFEGNIFEEAQEFAVVGGGRRIAGGAAVQGGETGGVHPRGAMEGVDFETRIVGEDEGRCGG